MLPRPPLRRSAKPRPRAWRVTDRKPRLEWGRTGLAAIAIIVAGGTGAGLLVVSGVFGAPASRSTPTAQPAASRQIVSSTIRGNTPTPTFSPVAVTPATPVASAQPQPSATAALSVAPPVVVQRVTPIIARSTSASASASGLVRPAASATPRASAGTSIADELKAINATATALTERAGSLSASSSPAAGRTARPTATDTPIPTAAPPVVPNS